MLRVSFAQIKRRDLHFQSRVISNEDDMKSPHCVHSLVYLLLRRTKDTSSRERQQENIRSILVPMQNDTNLYNKKTKAVHSNTTLMMNSLFRTLFAAALLVSMTSGAAFVPQVQKKTALVTTTSGSTKLQFKFLKDLGLEKPSWLPDFGGKKEEESASEKSEEEGESSAEGEGEEAVASED